MNMEMGVPSALITEMSYMGHQLLETARCLIMTIEHFS